MQVCVETTSVVDTQQLCCAAHLASHDNPIPELLRHQQPFLLGPRDLWNVTDKGIVKVYKWMTLDEIIHLFGDVHNVPFIHCQLRTLDGILKVRFQVAAY